jgi:hypothetical protein
MKNYFTFDLNFDYLLNSVKALHSDNKSGDIIENIYEWVLIADDNLIKNYADRKSLSTYKNDLDLYVSMIDNLIEYYESIEEFEKCERLLNRKNQFIGLL